MKFISYILQMFLSLLSCVSIVLLVLFLVLNTNITKENFFKHIKGSTFIEMQKTKLKSDLDSVSLANGVDPKVFEGFITSDKIIHNNEEYIEGVFLFIKGNAPQILSTTPTAENLENEIKQTLFAYAKGYNEKEFAINENAINSFAALEKLTFSKSAVPILGFETIANFLKTINKYSKHFLIADIFIILLSFGILLFINKANKKIAFATFLYAFSASSLLLSLLNGAIYWIVTTKNTALNYSYIKYIVLSYSKTSLIIGLVIFVLSQIVLAVLFKKSGKKDELK